MESFSRYEIEQICETVYYQALDLMSRYDYADSAYEFQNLVEQDFKEWTYPKFNWRIQESDKSIVYKWQQKVRNAAKEWYENNVERRREEELKEERRRKEERKRQEEARERKEREERERKEEINRQIERERREHEKWIREKIKNLNERLHNNDIQVNERVMTALKANSLDRLKDILGGLEDERKKIIVDISELPEYFQDECKIWIEKISEYKKKIENKISIIQEEERLAKRKAQEEENLRKLKEMQAQWRGKQNQSPSNQSENIKEKQQNKDIISCPQCGNQVSSTAKFCTNCGTKLLVVCENCGTSLKSTAKFCTNCGTPIAQNTKSDTNLKENKPLEKESDIVEEEDADNSDFRAVSLFTFAMLSLDSDTENAIGDIERAAEMNHIPALNFLGSCYYSGEYVKEDKEKAEKYLKKASELGDPTSQYEYAILLKENGRAEEYSKWLRKSAEAGYRDAQYLMGSKIMEEIEEDPNEDSPELKELIKWMSLAAEQNHGGALYILGLLYAEKEFSGYSIPKAKELLQKAIENGEEDAIESLNELNEKFPE